MDSSERLVTTLKTRALRDVLTFLRNALFKPYARRAPSSVPAIKAGVNNGFRWLSRHTHPQIPARDQQRAAFLADEAAACPEPDFVFPRVEARKLDIAL